MPLTPDKVRALDALITRFNNSGGSGVTKEQFAAELSSLGVTAADLAAYSQIRSGPWLAALPGVMGLLVAGGGVKDAFTDPNKNPRTGATDIVDDALNVVGSSGNAAAAGAQQGASTPQNIVESYLAQGYTRDNVNPNILFKWVDDPQNPGAKKMDVVNVASIMPGGGAGGSGGGSAGRTRTIVNNREGRALIIDENGMTVGENTDLFKPPEPKAPDQWYNADNGSVFEYKDGQWQRNALLSTNKAGTVQVNHDTGLAYQWDNKAGQWARATQFDTNPTISPAQQRADEMRRFDLTNQMSTDRFNIGNEQAVRSEQNNAAATTRGQDFSLAGVLGNLALQDSKFFADTVSRGSDYISRAFSQRGGTSPYPTVTNADLINSLAGGRAAAQATIDRLAAERPKFDFTAPRQAVAAPLYTAPPPTPVSPAAAAPSPVSTGAGFDQAANNAAIAKAAQSMGLATPGFARGTKGTKARKFIVGDPQVAGEPNVEHVTVHNPGKDTTVEVEPVGHVQQMRAKMARGQMPRFALGTDPAALYQMLRAGGATEQAAAEMINASLRSDQALASNEAAALAAQEAAVQRSSMGSGAGSAVSSGVPAMIGRSVRDNEEAAPAVSGWEPAYSAPRFAFGTDAIDGGAGSGATGVKPEDVSMGMLSGPAYDWYDPQTGSAGYGAFNPGSGGDSGSGYGGGSSSPGLSVPSSPLGSPPAKNGVMLPTLPTVRQEDLVAAAKAGAGPAITSLMSGQRAPSLRFNFAVARPQDYANLTNDERDALNSYLGVVENTSLADVERNASQLFGRTGTGYGARRSFALR